MLRNTSERWGAVAILLHWLLAVLVIGLMTLGWVAVTEESRLAQYSLFKWHKSFGMLVLALVLLRLLWRLFNPTPALPMHVARWERWAARTTHWLLYGVMIAMPLSGWIMNAAADFPFKIFGVVPLPDIVAPNEALEETTKAVHLALFWILAVALTLHIGAALKHHFVDRDSVLLRMLPGRWHLPPLNRHAE
jgi:cytochrome b561